MDFRHLIVTCLFSKLRLPFDNQKVKENYAILIFKIPAFSLSSKDSPTLPHCLSSYNAHL